MFHLFQTYVAKKLSYCNIRRRMKRAHVDVVPTGVVVPTLKGPYLVLVIE
jgi:hypothetical protein